MKSREIAVLLFTGTRVRYGAEEHMLTLLRELPRLLFRFHMVCPPELAERIRGDLPADVELIELSLSSFWRVRDILEFAKILKKRRIDILHSHMSFSSRFASPIGWACGVPAILETTHVAENWRRGWLKSSNLPDRAFGYFVDFFIAVSEANASYLINQKGLPRGKVVVIRNGCDLSRFSVTRDKRFAMRKDMGLHEDTPTLIVPARLEPQKGHSVLLDAVSLIRREFPMLQVFCLGEGSLRKDLEAKVHLLGLQETVRFLGFQPNVNDWFDMGDLTVLSSFYEGLPLVAIESLAASRAVVATAVDGTPEVVVDGITGKTVPPGQPGALAEAICDLLRQPALIEKLGRQGRDLVQREFNQQKQVQQTAELYCSCLGRPARYVGTRASSTPDTERGKDDERLPAQSRL
jgi:glycosyltransferase involved in cell wall biosynthesis